MSSALTFELRQIKCIELLQHELIESLMRSDEYRNQVDAINKSITPKLYTLTCVSFTYFWKFKIILCIYETLSYSTDSASDLTVDIWRVANFIQMLSFDSYIERHSTIYNNFRSAGYVYIRLE